MRVTKFQHIWVFKITEALGKYNLDCKFNYINEFNSATIFAWYSIVWFELGG